MARLGYIYMIEDVDMMMDCYEQALTVEQEKSSVESSIFHRFYMGCVYLEVV